jgi:hypothetical protein
MNYSVRNALVILGTAVVVLIIFSKNKKSNATGVSNASGNKISAPATASSSEKKKIENAHIALDAMRSAVDAGETSDNLNKLNRILANEYGVKVYPQKDGAMMVCDRSGASILKG